jgi:hypothetical protein
VLVQPRIETYLAKSSTFAGQRTLAEERAEIPRLCVGDHLTPVAGLVKAMSNGLGEVKHFGTGYFDYAVQRGADRGLADGAGDFICGHGLNEDGRQVDLVIPDEPVRDGLHELEELSRVDDRIWLPSNSALPAGKHGNETLIRRSWVRIPEGHQKIESRVALPRLFRALVVSTDSSFDSHVYGR